tara:strand:- start:188 stop:598 length:411 start_codon:yes stop_codon:yes gene_type:complete
MLEKKEFSIFCILAFVSLGSTMAQEEELNCAPTGDAMAKRVQEILHPGYVEKTAVPQKTTLAAIDNLLEEAGYCAAVARAGGTSGEDRQRFIMEWHSMNQWLSRIAGFIALNVREDFSMDWKKEYELFLEVYELTN